MLPTHEAPTHLHVEDRVFFGVLTVRQLFILAGGVMMAAGMIMTPPLPLPRALFVPPALVVAALAAVWALWRPMGRSLEDWALALLRYWSSPRVAVWRPLVSDVEDEGEGARALVIARRARQARGPDAPIAASRSRAGGGGGP